MLDRDLKRGKRVSLLGIFSQQTSHSQQKNGIRSSWYDYLQENEARKNGLLLRMFFGTLLWQPSIA